MNTAAQLALSTSIAAVAKGVADLAKAIANHPVVQADDSGDILKAAEELTGFSTQLESMATSLNPAPAGDATGGATGGDATGGATGGDTTGGATGGDTTGGATGGDTTGGATGGDTTSGATGGDTTGVAPAPEAGSAEGPGTHEPGPETV